MTRAHSLCGLFLLLTIGLLGCSGNSHAPARVSGSVSYKGQPIKAGKMQFHTPDGVAYDAQISSDGTYTATDVPVGELVITVETESLKPKAGKGKDAEKRAGMVQKPPPGVASAPAPADYYIKIPEKYSNAKTSPLTLNVSRGRQVHNVDLTD